MIKKNHEEIVNDYYNLIKNNLKTKYMFMLTISRDGEHPVRSIYMFDDSTLAVEAFNRYDNFGFAKEYLTVKLYEPNGRIHEKVLKRPPAGECSYVRQNYIEASNLLLSMKDSLNKDQYSKLVEGFALIFSQDNIRFDSDRFFDDCQYTMVE